MPSPRLTSQHLDTVETIHAKQRQFGVTLQLLLRAAGMDDENEGDPDLIPVLLEGLCHQHWSLLRKCEESVREAEEIDFAAEMVGAMNQTMRVTPWIVRRLLETAADKRALGRFDKLVGAV